MSDWRREAEDMISATLGEPVPRWVDWPEALTAEWQLPIVLSLVGHSLSAEDRRAVLERAREAVPAGTVLIVVDHNRPRQPGAAVAALVRSPWVPGGSPLARWRRLAYPTAREVQGGGFGVEKLRLVAGERVQIVLARRSAG